MHIAAGKYAVDTGCVGFIVSHNVAMPVELKQHCFNHSRVYGVREPDSYKDQLRGQALRRFMEMPFMP
jgi:hypothetical protein